MSDFKSLKKEYDDLLQKATNEPDQTARDADIAQLIILKQKMADAITSSLGTAGEEMGEKRQLLLAELARIQYDYNGLLESGDKLKTLHQIRDYEQGKSQPISFSMYEIGLGVASVLLVALLFIRR
jgi:hypothetical protein